MIEDGVTGDGVIERYDPADALGMIRLDRGGTLRFGRSACSFDPVAGHRVRVVEVRPVTGALASSFFARVYRRSATAFREGEHIDTVDARFVVGGVVGGRPRRVELDFARPFEGRGTCLLRWRGAGLERFDPPPVGASVTLRHEPGPFGM